MGRCRPIIGTLDGFDAEAIPVYHADIMVRTSVSLPDDLTAELARLGPSAARRSEIVVNALRAYLEFRSQPRGDTEILNDHAEELNAHAEEVLEFQLLP
jgi:predicted transcriptional regulator